MALAMNAGPGSDPSTPPPAGSQGPDPSNQPPHHLDVTARAFLWIGRGMAAVLLLLSGAFLLEHVREWYLEPKQAVPPTWVAVGVLLHLGMLAGLALCLRWTLLGSVVTLATTLAFIVETGIASGYVPLIVLYTLTPLLFFGAYWKLRRTAGVVRLT